MIVQEFSLPVKQIRIDTYNFCLILVLLITQIETSVVFVCNFKTLYYSCCNSKITGNWTGKQKYFYVTRIIGI